MFRRKKQAATVPETSKTHGACNSFVGDDAYDIQIGVAMPLNEPDDRGMPRQHDMQALAAFEDDLLAALSPHRVVPAPFGSDMANALVGRVETIELWPFAGRELAAPGGPTFVDVAFDAPANCCATAPRREPT